ncbi:MAG: hypothetical protein IKZ29_07805 [Clostridiales bacterium]|nr:hypothetical protein [Clostridiales bacterium]
MIELLSFLFASGVGFGLACWIFGTLLDKSNNIGDSHGSMADYRAYVSFTARKDRLNKEEKASFCSRYAQRIDDPSTEPKGSERVRRLTDEEIAEFKRAAEEKKAAQRAREKEIFGTTENEFELWESQNPSTSLKGVFKPLNEE